MFNDPKKNAIYNNWLTQQTEALTQKINNKQDLNYIETITLVLIAQQQNQQQNHAIQQ